MGRRTTTAVLLGIVLTLLAGCGKQGCSTLPQDSGIQIQIPRAIQKVVRTLQVELCQGSTCRSTTFTVSANGADGQVVEGVTQVGDAFDIDLSQFGKGWRAETEERLKITGTTESGRIVLKRTDKFTFTSAYPNGRDCDDSPSLTYSTSVAGEDLVG
jgi:hypothetical protein